MYRSDFFRPKRALYWVRFVLSAASYPLSAEEIFLSIHDEMKLAVACEEAVPKWDFNHLVLADALHWGCRHGEIIAKARRCGSDSCFEVISAEEWANLRLQMSGCDCWDTPSDIQDQCENSLTVKGCSWHQRPGVYGIVLPTNALVQIGSGKAPWEMVVYSLAQQAKNTPEIPRRIRFDNVARSHAIKETIREFGHPGQDAPWERFCDRVRSKAGVGPKRRGFGDKSIQRAVKRLSDRLKPTRDRPDI